MALRQTAGDLVGRPTVSANALGATQDGRPRPIAKGARGIVRDGRQLARVCQSYRQHRKEKS